jgi:hypothetical protein
MEVSTYNRMQAIKYNFTKCNLPVRHNRTTKRQDIVYTYAGLSCVA